MRNQSLRFCSQEQWLTILGRDELKSHKGSINYWNSIMVTVIIFSANTMMHTMMMHTRNVVKIKGKGDLLKSKSL
jgi:hypothetical protein